MSMHKLNIKYFVKNIFCCKKVKKKQTVQFPSVYRKQI